MKEEGKKERKKKKGKTVGWKEGYWMSAHWKMWSLKRAERLEERRRN